MVAGPSPELRESGRVKKEITGREAERYEFWQQLLSKSNEQFNLFKAVTASSQRWLMAGAGKTDVAWEYVIMIKTNGMKNLELHH